MPSRSSRARRRFRTDRIIAKRLAQARSLGWLDEREFIRGRLEHEQWYLGCHKARCRLCHAEKRWSHGDRQREDRRWRIDEDSAWNGADDCRTLAQG
jgi:hypothetical protein